MVLLIPARGAARKKTARSNKHRAVRNSTADRSGTFGLHRRSLLRCQAPDRSRGAGATFARAYATLEGVSDGSRPPAVPPALGRQWSAGPRHNCRDDEQYRSQYSAHDCSQYCARYNGGVSRGTRPVQALPPPQPSPPVCLASPIQEKDSCGGLCAAEMRASPDRGVWAPCCPTPQPVRAPTPNRAQANAPKPPRPSHAAGSRQASNTARNTARCAARSRASGAVAGVASNVACNIASGTAC